MKLRILEKYDNLGEPYYIVQEKKFLLGWTNLWPDYNWSDDGEFSWDRTFKSKEDAEKAIEVYRKSSRKPSVIKEIEI